MNLDNFQINWFDFVLLIMILLGANKGRKHGMSVEMMVSLQWVAIVLLGACFYRPIGDMVAQSSAFTHLFCYIAVYIGIALVVKMVFTLIKKGAGGKLVGSSIFGRGEFYLGMVAGGIRFACIVLAAMALLNARAYNSQEIATDLKYQKDMYGSDFWPHIYTTQAAVFRESLVGKAVKDHAEFLLITPTAPEIKTLKRKDNLP
jgi:uncharacterized membrane protein required for colicin V production